MTAKRLVALVLPLPPSVQFNGIAARSEFKIDVKLGCVELVSAILSIGMDDTTDVSAGCLNDTDA